MKLIFNKEINIKGLRYPKFFEYNNQNYLIGSSLFQRGIYENNEISELRYFNNEQDENILKNYSDNEINKYTETLFLINENLEIKEEQNMIFNNEFRNDIFKTTWIRDINIDNENNLIFNVEHKFNIENKHFEDHNYQYKTNNFKDFKIIKKYDDVNSFLFKDYNGYIFHCDIKRDDDDKEYFWGKYLFFIKKNNKTYQPKFDKIVNYEKDKGHLMHNLIKINEEEFLMLFSIRHHLKEHDFEYKIYTSITKDFINFYNTKEVEINKKNNNSKFFSYPHLFNYKTKWYIICNQDDFGKNKNLILFDVFFK